MGAVAAEANDFWARVQTGENQQLPDTKARVRFLLDEIALLQTRFESKKQLQPERAQERPADEKQQVEKEAEVQDAPANENLTSDDPATSEISVHKRCDDFLQFIEEKLRNLVDERVGFFETAEKELRIGKVELPELGKLLRQEKSKLQGHRLELDEFRAEWKRWWSEDATKSCLWSSVEEILEKFVKLLDEQESLHLKFEVQVELGHFFRLLKLLEVQKARDENSKRELERTIQELREVLEKETKACSNDAQHGSEEDYVKELDVVGDFDPASEQEQEKNPEEQETDGDCETNMMEQHNFDVSTAIDYQESKKEAKQEVLKLMAEQEQRWRDQLSVLREMENRLTSSELETQRVSSLLEERRHCECRNRRVEATVEPAHIPQGYTSIYFSPIFQERKQASKPQRDEKDAEIQRLRKELNHLKEALSSHEKQASDGFPNPPEEKTILVDASFKPDELCSSSSFFASESLDSVVCSSLNEEDKKFCEKAVQKMFLIIQQHRSELSSGKLQSAGIEKAFVGAFRNMSLQIRQLSEDLQAHFNVETPQASGNTLKETEVAARAKMDQLDDEHSQELERKEKTLKYAQELNLQLANDMSRTENSLAELRMEHLAVKLSMEAELKASQREAEALAEMLRSEITSLATKLSDKDRALLESTGRAEACQRETDAAVLEKNSCLERLQRALNEQSLKTQRLEDEDAQRCREVSSQLQETREELERAGEARQALERRYNELQTKLFDTEYELAQREAALERLSLHLTAYAQEGGFTQTQEVSTESLRSKHRKKELARKSIQEVEEKMLEISTEMARAKSEMEEMKSQSFQLLRRLRIK